MLVVALFLAYKPGRQIISGHAGEATANAASVWRLERWLHLPSELTVQHTLLGHGWLVTAADSYYAYVHFPATAAVLIWLYLFRAPLYLRTRRVLAWLTAAALVVHVWFPLAPGRLVPATGLLDTGALFGPSVYGPPDTDTLTNQYAAMPSLHVGWALAVAVALVAAGRGRWRWLWLAHPLITLLVVVSTGNHYWLDAIVAVAMLAATAALVLRHRGNRATPAPAPSSQRYRRSRDQTRPRARRSGRWSCRRVAAAADVRPELSPVEVGNQAGHV
ncbi:phosphatase PAP2 family protein [Asanoa ishikariensis]|nr:phosphatase PAP2 family protein [Asanoa ishikariensis]